jgi:2-(1,2-epoxy-1,2-dihydrophenyl)acetyl-CoA isomerase
MVRLGLVGEVVDDDRFEARLAEYCALLAERAPLASRLTKRGIVRATGIDLEAQVRYELANILRAFATEDAQEARRAFFEKRAPTFRGR